MSEVPPKHEWRCFHCGDVFTDADTAMEHFGTSQVSDPACCIDIAKFREMEESQRRYSEEDTELHRALHAKQSEMDTAVIRAEELGYARGLADAKKYPEELGLVKLQ